MATYASKSAHLYSYDLNCRIREFLEAPLGVKAFLFKSSEEFDPRAIQEAFPKNQSCFVIDSAALAAVLDVDPSLLATLSMFFRSR